MTAPTTYSLTGFVMPVGNGAVGKTSVSRVLDVIARGREHNGEIIKDIRKTNNLEFEYITTKQIFGKTTYSVTLQFLVPPGQKDEDGDLTGRTFEKVIGIYRSLIRRLDVVLFTYDVANHESFQDLAYWVDGVGSLMNDTTHFILLGTHMDCEDEIEISKDEIRNGLEYLRKEILIMRPSWQGKCTNLEVSNLSGENLPVLLRYLAGSVVMANRMKS
jgi:GTPase SAR1 family protein